MVIVAPLSLLNNFLYELCKVAKFVKRSDHGAILCCSYCMDQCFVQDLVRYYRVLPNLASDAVGKIIGRDASNLARPSKIFCWASTLE